MKQTEMSILDIATILLIVGTLGIGAYLLFRRRSPQNEQGEPKKETKDLITSRVMEKITLFESTALSYYLYDQSQLLDTDPIQMEEISSKYGIVKTRPYFKPSELADLGSRYYRIDKIVSKYLDDVNYREHSDLLPIDRLELMIYEDAEKKAKEILGNERP